MKIFIALVTSSCPIIFLTHLLSMLLTLLPANNFVSIEMLMHFCAYLFVIHHPLYVQTNKVESYPFTVYGSLNIENGVVVGTRKHFEVTNVYKLFCHIGIV